MEFVVLLCCPVNNVEIPDPALPYATHCLLKLTSCSTVLPQKLTDPQLVKLPAFYGTLRSITAFTTARYLSLSWARAIQSLPPHLTSWRSILNYPPIYAWVFQVVSFPQVSPPKSCMHLSPPPYVLHARPFHYSWFDYPNIWWWVQILKLLFM
jgi:hypothetical protein